MTNERAFEQIRTVLATREPRPVEGLAFPRAAVLIPVIARAGGPSVLFTQRTETVHDHKGQVSFPGGRAENGEDARENALRESFEEVGLDPARVEIAGTLDDQLAVSRYLVTPLVGLVHEPPKEWQPQASEVAHPFEVPLVRLLDPKNVRRELWGVDRMPPNAPVKEILDSRITLEEVDPVTGEYAVYFFDGGDGRVIWGLTARILKQLLDVAFEFALLPDATR